LLRILFPGHVRIELRSFGIEPEVLVIEPESFEVE
jgi:hypothetical protein